MTDFRAERPVWTDQTILYAKTTIDGKQCALRCDGIRLEEVKDGMPWPEFLLLPDGFSQYGQSLFQALWDVGFRPHNGESSVAHVQAMKDHLEDMRRLVFESTAPT